MGALAQGNHRPAAVPVPRVRLAGWLPISVGDAIEAREAARRKAADPPNLQGTAFARNLQRLTLDVKQLDRFHQTTDEDSDS
ncbi:MAG: hypothetical protein A3F70_03630 [Acidobacteria bacterium RIFCSPLOWO2_12_FULL_67_14]|nr:MAG: hypothetical protein A3F70_03630 [Acidobacteria bacterium RIFCSPLOWO2_12_FULL_67_14]